MVDVIVEREKMKVSDFFPHLPRMYWPKQGRGKGMDR